MIPQNLTGENVQVKVTFSDGSTPITATLKGEWKAGTTKVYALSQITSSWNYVLNVTSPAAVAYDQTTTGNYTVQSYRKVPATYILQPVKWKVVGYQESADGGTTWSTLSDTKPAWLTALSLKGGDGTPWGSESGLATVQKTITDKLAAYNKVLHDATPKGSAGNYYNLSNPTGAAPVMNTANSYLISAPGYYKIPLVYGNAIKNGTDNPHSYSTSASAIEYGIQKVLQKFSDHDNQEITSPWITLTNGGANIPNGVKIVWTDQSGLVTDLGLEGSGNNAFIHFRVPQDKIRNGNAVIAITQNNIVVWSWHLWFDHADVLNVTPIVNHQGVTYKFTEKTLGFAYRKWESTTYDKPRIVRIKVEQMASNNGIKQFAYIDIAQNPGSVKENSGTLYQWGRKDAMPGIDNVIDGTFTVSDQYSLDMGYCIRNPDTSYKSWTTGWYNLWSMDKDNNGHADENVVKTVYDPCPPGFKMPAGNAFTSFETSPGSSVPNISGPWDGGLNFKSASGSETVFFPGLPCRLYDSLQDQDNYGYQGSYWMGSPISGYMHFYNDVRIEPTYNNMTAYSFSVRPVTE